MQQMLTDLVPSPVGVRFYPPGLISGSQTAGAKDPPIFPVVIANLVIGLVTKKSEKGTCRLLLQSCSFLAYSLGSLTVPSDDLE